MRINADKPVKIRAEMHPDDHHVEVHFDAELWFSQADIGDLIKLICCEARYSPPEWGGSETWGQDRPADAVAQFMAEHDTEVAYAFKYIENSGDLGFECYIHGEDARRWLSEHWPEIANFRRPEGDEVVAVTTKMLELLKRVDDKWNGHTGKRLERLIGTTTCNRIRTVIGEAEKHLTRSRRV